MRRWGLLAALAVAGLLAGCGVVTAAAPAAPLHVAQYYHRRGAPVTVSAGQALTISTGDFYFDPNTLTVLAPGTQITLRIRNYTPMRHTFTLPAAGVNAVLYHGLTTTVRFSAPAAGTYSFYCSEPGHAQQGMVGELVVR